MSWILKLFFILIIIIIVVAFLLAAFYVGNRLTRHFIYGQVRVFSAGSRVRNVGSLLIGEIPSAKECEKIISNPGGVRLFLPDASIGSCYEVLRHTHSILNENGSMVVLAYSRSKKGYSIFDIPFFHEVTIKRLGLGKLKKRLRFPLLWSPWESIRFLTGRYRKHHVPVECMDGEMLAFCRERNIKLILLEV